MLFCILLFIILSFAMRLPVEKWRDTRVMIAMSVVAIGLMLHNIIDGVLVAVWYIFLISDYGKLFLQSEHFFDATPTTTCTYYTPSQPASGNTVTKMGDTRKDLWDNTYKKFTSSLASVTPFDPFLQTQLQTLYEKQIPEKYRYNSKIDTFPVNV